MTKICDRVRSQVTRHALPGTRQRAGVGGGLPSARLWCRGRAHQTGKLTRKALKQRQPLKHGGRDLTVNLLNLLLRPLNRANCVEDVLLR